MVGIRLALCLLQQEGVRFILPLLRQIPLPVSLKLSSGNSHGKKKNLIRSFLVKTSLSINNMWFIDTIIYSDLLFVYDDFRIDNNIFLIS